MGYRECVICKKGCFPAAACDEHLVQYESIWEDAYHLGWLDGSSGKSPWRSHSHDWCLVIRTPSSKRLKVIGNPE